MSKKYGTAGQNAAYSAGIDFAHGKAKQNVTIQPENKAAFRDGVADARKRMGISKSVKEEKSLQDKIKYYSGRIDDPKLSERQRRWAIKRLGDLAKK